MKRDKTFFHARAIIRARAKSNQYGIMQRFENRLAGQPG